MKGIPHLVILDGDDASVITLEGRTKVLQDKYGLEFPWRPKNLLALFPKPLRRYFQSQLEYLTNRAQNLLRGVLESLAPSKLIKYASSGLNYLTSRVLPSLFRLIQRHISPMKTQPSADIVQLES